MDIIACVISLIFLSLSVCGEKKNKSISPNVIFFGLWSFILFLSVLNLYNIIKPSNEAYLLIILMLMFFYFGNVVNNIFRNKDIKLANLFLKKKINDNKKIKPMFKLFYFMCFLIILFNIIDLTVIVKNLNEGVPMWQIRNWGLEPYGSSNPLVDRRSFAEEAIRAIILIPFSMIIPPVTAYYFFNSKDNKQRWKLLIISLIELVSSSISGGGGRLGFIYYFGCFLLAFFIIYKNKEISKDVIKKYKKNLFAFFLLAIIFVTAYTIFRAGIENIIKQIYTYFALPPTLLSLWLPSIKNIDYTYGMTTFFGLHSYFFRILETIGLGNLVPEIYNIAFTHILNAEIFKDVGYGIGNAFVTPIYYFLIDGGYFFVVIASFLFGYIVSNLYKRFEENINIRSFTIYALIVYGIFVTFMRIQTAIPAYIISFILVYIILRPSRLEEENDENKVKEKKIYKKYDNEVISVIIPIYNVEKYINECIESVINQTYSNLEIILIDDGSPDNCGKICDDYAQKDKRIKVIHRKNCGVSKARNVGLDNASGKYITFIDSDDSVSESYCKELLDVLKKEDVDAVACGYNRIYGDKKEKIVSKESYVLKGINILNEILTVQSGLGFCHMKLWKRSCIGNIRFDENLKVGEDALFNMKISKNINQLYVLNKELYNYRFNEKSVVRKYDKDYVQKYLQSMQIAKNYIEEQYIDNNCIMEKLYNYMAYHVLLIIVNYCINSENNLKFINQIDQIKEVCNIKEFKDAIEKCSYDGFSVTRKVTIFTLKCRLYILTGIIGKIRQLQFKRSNKKHEK